MDKLLYSIDFTAYNYRNEDTLSIEGWAFDDGNTPKTISIKSGGKEVPFHITWKKRPDINEVHPSVNMPDEPGFTIEIPHISNMPQDLDLYLDNEHAYHMDRDAIKEMISDAVIIYQLDVLAIRKGTLVVHGWYVDQMGNNKILALDSSGQEIPCEIYRTVREDANALYSDYIDKDVEVGFTVKVPKDKTPSNKIIIRFQSEDCYKDEEVDVKELIREGSKGGRLFNALRPRKFKDNIAFIREKGFSEFANYLQRIVYPEYLDYTRWVKNHQPTAQEISKQKHTTFKINPKISIVIPLFNTPIKYLEVLLNSINHQTYKNWELCLADASTKNEVEQYIQKHYGRDSRIKYQRLKNNGGISENTNAALAMATGDYIMLSDHDDIVEQGALYEIVKAINENPELDIIYTDEDKITMDGKEYFDPNFKPDFNPFMMECNNYVCHIFVVRASVMKQVGGFRKEFDGAQDYDLILRCWEQTALNKIHHIPKILYHWRSHPGSTAENPQSKLYAYEAGANALDEHFRRMGVNAKAEQTQNHGIYRIYREVTGNPLVSIIIPNKDHVDDLETCLSSVTEKTTYENYEILVVENNSTEEETFAYYKEMTTRYPKVKLLEWKQEFNYAAINNFAVKEAKGEYLLFLNNDVELITPKWIEEFLGIAQQKNVGMVGAKLYYPDETVQHAGVIIGLGGVAGHIFCGKSRYESGYLGRGMMPQNLSAVTAACMMMKTEVFHQVGGFDESFKVAFNDVDLCMKTLEAGYQIVFNPYVELYHYESKSRGMENTKEKEDRFYGEVNHFRQKWPDILENGDPNYNVNLSLKDGNCNLRE